MLDIGKNSSSEKLVIDNFNIVQSQYGNYRLVGHVTPKQDMRYIEARIEYYTNDGVLEDKDSLAWNIRDVKANQELNIERHIVMHGAPDYAIVSFYKNTRGENPIAQANITFV